MSKPAEKHQDRRSFLLGLGSLAFAAGLPAGLAAEPAPSMYAACAKDQSGFAAYTFASNGEIKERIRLPDRGHGLAYHQGQSSSVCAIFARRPGRYILVKEHDTWSRILIEENRFLNGHGVFSKDGRYLYVTCSVTESAAGLIAVYDRADNWQKIAEWPTAGLDPHELVFHSNGRLLIVANGGRLTHPDFPRQHLNPGEIESSLITLDTATGRINHKAQPPELNGKVSLRHMAAWQNQIWWGGQLESGTQTGAPIIGTYTLDHGLDRLKHKELTSFGRYVGSVGVSTNKNGGIIFTNPRNDIAICIDPQTRQITHRWHIPDVCGVAHGPEAFLSDGRGHIGSPHQRIANHGIQWDNHMIRLY